MDSDYQGHAGSESQIDLDYSVDLKWLHEHFFSIQDVIDDKLDQKHFPFLAGRVAPSNAGNRIPPTRLLVS